YDPSVNFELEFDVSVALPTGDNDTDDLEIVSELRLQDDTEEDETEAPAKPAKKPAKKADRSKTTAKEDSSETTDKEEAPKPSADVVSLNAFR
ncbi:hypothetical protein NSP53_23350, partial [Salmonella enterica]|nr:hypothetical protein [Salmonella enterica]